MHWPLIWHACSNAGAIWCDRREPLWWRCGGWCNSCRLANFHPCSLSIPKPFSLRAPEPYSFFFPPGSMQSFLPSRLVWSSLAATAWARTTSKGSNVCSTLHLSDIAVDSVLNVHRTRGGRLPSECAKLCCKMMPVAWAGCYKSGLWADIHWWVEILSSSDSMGFCRRA